MRPLTVRGAQAVADIAARHGFGIEATHHMLEAVIGGDGRMAQFGHREFAGAGQWMSGGMTMVADMFDDRLKGRVDALCRDLADLVAREPELFTETAPPTRAEVAPGRPSLSAVPRSGDWWPGGFGHPNSVGSQGGMRYAYFARAQRLAIERDGVVTLYDSRDHDITGVSQQQGAASTLRFTSQHGAVDVANLAIVDG